MGRTIILRFLLFLSLSVPSVSIMERISDLKGIRFGKTFPRHGLKLLYWLANNTQIDQNDVIDFRDIDPARGDYGFHLFGNQERIPLPSGPEVVHYAFGNLNTQRYPKSRELPGSVTNDFYNPGYPHRNDDRIIVQCDSNNRMGRVFISVHYDRGLTWEISPQLLREIQNIPTQDEFLRQAGYDSSTRENINKNKFYCDKKRPRRQRSLPECDTSEGLKLDMQPSSTAKARITWSNIPKTILNKNLVLRVYANMDRPNSTELESHSVGQNQSGFIDTSVGLNSGLQVRLMEKETGYLFNSYTQIWASPEFDEGNRKLPTDVVGYDASLQLFVKQGKACVRLYIKRSFTDWKNTFSKSWVGFYLTSDEGHSSYVTWQWATEFTENQDRDTDGYLAYEYESGVDIQGGVQARFFLKKAYSSVRAQGVPWGQEAISQIQNNVRGYDASLQLMRSGGKVCARLYIKRTFTDWKGKFTNAWVGFYSSSSARSISTYNWVTSFKRNEEHDTEKYMAYDYESNTAFSPGVEARFFLSKDYSQEKGRTGLIPDPYFYPSLSLAVSRAVKHSAGLSFLASLLPCILASLLPCILASF